MSDTKPSIYAFCPAGCKWETVHKSDVPYKEVMISKADFDALEVKDKDTMYFVYNAGSESLPEVTSINVPVLAESSGQYLSGNQCYDFSFINSTNNRTIAVMPIDSYKSVASVTITQIAGDTGYLAYSDIRVVTNAITADCINISSVTVYGLNNSTSQATHIRSATFLLEVKDIYTNSFTHEFTINFKTTA